MCEDGDQVVGVKVEEGCCMQEEEDPEPTTSAVIKTEPAVSSVCVCVCVSSVMRSAQIPRVA